MIWESEQMTYKGYTGALEIDEDSGELFGMVLGTRDTITFVGMTVEEAKRCFEETIDAYLKSCETHGEEPSQPFTGRFHVRIEPELHRRLAVIAHSIKKEVNDLVVVALTRFADTQMRDEELPIAEPIETSKPRLRKRVAEVGGSRQPKGRGVQAKLK